MFYSFLCRSLTFEKNKLITGNMRFFDGGIKTHLKNFFHFYFSL